MSGGRAPGAGRHALVVQPAPTDPPGLLGEWLTERGWTSTVVDPVRRTPRPEDLDDVDAVAVLGSPNSARDVQVPWVRGVHGLLSAAVATHVPVLGICFGAQALAVALGGSVVRDATEIGWVDPQTALPPLAGPWFTWHDEAVTVAPDVEVLARSDIAIQAFRRGPHLGVQFHPEVTAAPGRAWMRAAAARGTIDDAAAGRLADELAAREPVLRRRTTGLLDWWEAAAHRTS